MGPILREAIMGGHDAARTRSSSTGGAARNPESGGEAVQVTDCRLGPRLARHGGAGVAANRTRHYSTPQENTFVGVTSTTTDSPSSRAALSGYCGYFA